MSLHDKSVSELSALLASGDVSSVELTQAALARIDKLDGQLNSFVTVMPETALTAAAAADQRYAAGDATALTGIPFAHKDIFCTAGTKTTCGSKMLNNFVPPYDATVVAKLAASGAVCVGKTNMDEFAMGSSNETSFYGVVNNPWDTALVPGGSSGGSAAAVAARLVPIATGTDTGGSIRQPASLCGVTGIKPTYGRVSRWGMIAFASSLDQAGVFGATAADCSLFLQQMAGFDERDSTSVDRPVEDYVSGLGESIKGLKIGLPAEFFDANLNDEVRQHIDAAVEVYKDLGAEIKPIKLPNIGLSVPVYYVVAPAECSSNLSRFDGVRFGHRCDNPKDLEDLYKRSRDEGFGAEVKRRIMIGAYVLSAGYYDAYYLKAQQLRRLIRDDFLAAFQDVDVILGPSAPGVAFGQGEQTDDPVQMYLNDIYTIGVNLAGLPGMSIPAGFIDDLPVGLQLIAPHFAEGRLLNVAHQYQQATQWHEQMPAQFGGA